MEKKTHSSPETMSKGYSIERKRQATLSKCFFHFPQTSKKKHSCRSMAPVPAPVRGIKELSFEKLIANIVNSFITTTGNLG